MNLLDYDAYVSGLSVSPQIQGYDVATMAVPVASGVSPSQPAGATVMQSEVSNGNGMATNGKPFMDRSLLGQPHKWWLILVGIAFLLNWLAKKYNVPRFTILQTIIIVLQNVVILVALKVVLTRYTIPGLSPIVISA
jgi:hypothetical protein